MWHYKAINVLYSTHDTRHKNNTYNFNPPSCLQGLNLAQEPLP